MRQAIETKYLPPTERRGARIVAKCQAKRIVRGWRHELSAEDNHKWAARELIALLKWDGGAPWAGGCPTEGNPAAYVFVQASTDSLL